MSQNNVAISALVDYLQKLYNTADGVEVMIEQRIAELTPETMLIIGDVADRLIFTKPDMLPKKVWGGGMGFRSSRRMNRLWELLGIASGTFPSGDIFLVRFKVAPQEWIPPSIQCSKLGTCILRSFFQHTK